MTVKPLIAIVGPTASGKSALAMQIAEQWNGEIVCADSRTIYKGMDIGTAKPSKEDQQKVPHHLLDVVEPSQPFTVADFKRLATTAIDDIAKRGRLPLLVGGTGLYIDSILFDYQFGPPAKPDVRARLEQLPMSELQRLSTEKGAKSLSNTYNRRHLVRSIERAGAEASPREMRDNTLVVGIAIDRDRLLQRIIARAEQMLADGILEEVEILSKKYGWENEAMTGSIYRLFRGVVEGDKSLHQALQEFVRSDIQLAKRQMTWFRRNPTIIWTTPDQAMQKVTAFLARQ